MKITKKYLSKFFLAWIFSMFSCIGFSQFNFNVSKTDETCVGNGTLTLQLSNTNSQADYTFAIYKLPNTTTTYLVTNSTFIEFLSNGTYLIEAIETINGASTVISRQITIDYLVEPLQYYVVEHETECNGTSLEIITTTGNPAFYEIFEGPTTYPQQESNIFHGLITDQTYQIRIYDTCGEGYARTHTIESEASFSFALNLSDSGLVTCDTYRVFYNVYSVFEYNNIEINYTITLPDNSVVVLSDFIDIPIGSSTTYVDVPFYSSESILVQVSLLDCLIADDIFFEQKIDYNPGRNECGVVYFSFHLDNFLAPYTVEFISFPDEFNPNDFNENHPSHNEDYILYGMQDNPLLFGSYSIKVSDSCGYSEIFDFEAEHSAEDPVLGFGSNGCNQNSGYFLIKFQTDREIVFAEIIDGPSQISPFPIDVSEHINEDGDLRVFDYPIGTYIVRFEDFCGFEYEKEISIPELDLSDFLVKSYTNCDYSSGTLRVGSQNGGTITEAIILDAPEDFPYDLPYNASGYINNNGVLFFPNLPMGNYLIQATDSCDYHQTTTIEVMGDVFNTSEFINVIKRCNVFDLDIELEHTSHSFNLTYWLQYYNETTEEWGHPFTGIPYINGTIPTEENSIKIVVTDELELQNIGIFGKFRIVKTHKVIKSDSPFRTEDCIKENYYTFEYNRDLTITDAYRIICENENQAVIIQAQGIPPLTYYITSKNGEPFYVDNGNNNIFTDLEPGIYSFQVRDNCGNIRNRDFNLEEIEQMVSSGQTDAVIECSEVGQNQKNFYLPDKNIYLIASTLSLEYFTITYHLSYQEAFNNNNHLPDNYTVQADTTVRIFVRIENDLIPNCFSIAFFDLTLIKTPDISDIETDYIFCENQQNIILEVPNIFDNYLWNDNSTGNSLDVFQAGTYSVIVSNTFGNVVCQNEIIFEVSLSGAPNIEKINYTDWTNSNNSITVDVSGNGDYIYSLGGWMYQESNHFENLSPGYYTIFVKDRNGCGEATSEALLLNYPRFFTPNGDGFNEYWRIQFGSFEPEMRISIFDRYGKLITVFMGDEQGWDGTFNGKRLLSTDYWFTVERKNGIIRKGHFSMVR